MKITIFVLAIIMVCGSCNKEGAHGAPAGVFSGKYEEHKSKIEHATNREQLRELRVSIEGDSALNEDQKIELLKLCDKRGFSIDREKIEEDYENTKRELEKDKKEAELAWGKVLKSRKLCERSNEAKSYEELHAITVQLMHEDFLDAEKSYVHACVASRKLSLDFEENQRKREESSKTTEEMRKKYQRFHNLAQQILFADTREKLAALDIEIKNSQDISDYFRHGLHKMISKTTTAWYCRPFMLFDLKRKSCQKERREGLTHQIEKDPLIFHGDKEDLLKKIAEFCRPLQ